MKTKAIAVGIVVLDLVIAGLYAFANSMLSHNGISLSKFGGAVQAVPSDSYVADFLWTAIVLIVIAILLGAVIVTAADFSHRKVFFWLFGVLITISLFIAHRKAAAIGGALRDFGIVDYRWLLLTVVPVFVCRTWLALLRMRLSVMDAVPPCLRTIGTTQSRRRRAAWTRRLGSAKIGLRR